MRGGIIAFALFAIAVKLSLVGAVIWVAYHFISKFW